MNRTEVILFDLDGVIIESPRIHQGALDRALASFKVFIAPEEHANVFNGLPTKRKLEILIQMNRVEAKDFDAICTLKQQYTRQYIQSECFPNPEQIELMKALKALGIRLGLCTNAVRETLNLVMEKAALTVFFDIALCNEDVLEPKPSPRFLLKR